MTPIAIENTTEAKPTSSDTREPKRIAENMSRPWSSVPSMKTRPVTALGSPGLVKPSIRLSEAASKAFCGAIHGANAAANNRIKTTALATIATGEWRKLHATSLSQACQRRVLKLGRGAVGARIYFAAAVEPRRRGSTAK